MSEAEEEQGLLRLYGESLVAIEEHLEVEVEVEHARDCDWEVLEAPGLCVRLEKEEPPHDFSVEGEAMKFPPLVFLEA